MTTRGTEGRRVTRATTHTTTTLILNTSLLSIVCSRSNASVLSAINANGDPREDTVRDVVAEQNVFHERVDGLSLLRQNAVFGICGQILRVGGVGIGLFDLGD